MSEELLQRDLIKNPEKIGKWDFYNIGATTVKALKEFNIIRNVNYGIFERKKVDALIVQNKNVIAVIEYKIPKKFKTAKDHSKAIEQEIEVAKKLGAKIFIATDTKEAIWINALTGNKIKDESGKDIKVLFNPKEEKLPELLKKVYDSINEKNNRIKPKELVNPTGLAKSIWQDIWSVSGESPTNCLYTFVELFIFKYLSDLKILGQGVNFNSLMERFEYDLDNPNEEALEYYATIIRPKIKRLFPYNPEDNTTIINGTVFVNKDDQPVTGYSTVFKKVLKKFQNYPKLENIEYDFKSQLFEEFLKEGISKKNLGQYFTPLKVVRSIVEMAKDDIKSGISICDPACGVGKFLLEPVLSKLDEFYTVKNGKLKSSITIHGFDKGFDKDEQKTIILAKANMLIYLSDKIKENPNITDQFSKVFNESFTLKTENILGTLADPVENKYDLILTNPPYVTSGSSNLKDEIKKDRELENYYKINAMGVEGLFMEWIIRALKPGGKAFVVIPDGILNRQNDKNLRKFILDECYIDGIISLPTKTFFTTPKKTYILAITKKANKKDTQKDPVFTYLVSEIGESRDIYRFDIEQNDLQEAVKLFKGFKGSPEYFIENNSDKRCKIQSIEKFDPEKHWSVDRWWSNEEKIKLEILEEDKTIPMEEFPDLLEDIANNILSFKEEILELNEKKKKEKKNYIKIEINKLLEVLPVSNKITKSNLKNTGKYPVYSSQFENNGLIGFYDTYNFLASDINKLITFGDHTKSFFIHNEKFSVLDNVKVLRVKKEYENNLNLEFLKYMWISKIPNLGYSRHWKEAKNIKIKIPINNKGDFDLLEQKEVAEKYKQNEEIKQKIEEYKKQINELNVEIKTSDQKIKSVKIDDVLDLSIKTNNSKFTKTFINKHKGDIPVYSASKFSEAVDYGYVEDNLKGIKYFEDCLTWNIDGSIGKAHYRKDRFSLSEKVIPLIVKNELQDKLDINFLKHTIESEFAKYSFGFGNKAGKGKIKNIEIQIPIDNQGNFDLLEQKEIAEKYKKIESIKKAINNELDKISETKIDL